MLDVLTTGLCRPDLYELSCRSFFSGRIKGLPPIHIILNVDPLGPGDPEAMLEVAHKFADKVTSNVASTANFSQAINWCTKQIQSDYVLHLEDDWLLLRSFSFDELLESLSQSEFLQLGLGYKKQRRPGSFSFRPSLIKAAAYDAAGSVPLNQNPEKFFANSLDPKCSVDWLAHPLVIDMGRKWAKGHGFRATGANSNWFVKRPQNLIARADWILSKARYQWISRRLS